MFEPANPSVEKVDVPQDPVPDIVPSPAKITLRDRSLGDYECSARVQQLRKAYFDACPEVCIERPHLVTLLHDELGVFGKQRYTVLDKARVYRGGARAARSDRLAPRGQGKVGVAFQFEGIGERWLFRQ